MEDKVFDLLEKVYIELQNTKTEFKSDIEDIKGDLNSINNRLTKIEIKMENEVKNKLDLLYEPQVDTNIRLDSLDKKMDELTEKVDQHDLKIKVIEGGKKKKSI